MKNNLFKRLAVSALALAMLVPCLMVAPASAEGGVNTIYHYVFNAGDGDREKNLAEFPNNIVNEKPSLSSAYPLGAATVYSEDGPIAYSFQGYANSLQPEKHSATAQHYGLPYEVLPGTNYKKITENLKLEMAGVKYPIDTKGMEALNLEFTYMYLPGSTWNRNNLVFDRELEIHVSLDGKTWLEDVAYIRSFEMLGGTMTRVPSNNQGIVYKIYTENLFNIEGLNPGDKIQKLMIRPNGDDTRTIGTIYFHDIAIKSYATMADFEANVPADDREYIHVGEETMRQIVVEEGLRVAFTPWTTDSIQHTSTPSGSSIGGGTIGYMRYFPGYQYSGPVYQRVTDSTRELFQSGIVNGKHMNGFATDNAYGMDCQTFAYNALSRANRTFAWAVLTTPNAPGVRMLGEDFLNYNFHVAFTDYDVTTRNTAQDMYKSYALGKAGDVFIVYSADSINTVHTRITRFNNVVYNADGTIDGKKSTMTFTEQNSTPRFEFKLADGTTLTKSCRTHEEVLAVLDEYPGSEVLFGHSTGFANVYTYENLLSNKYIGYTLEAYPSGNIELADVDITIASKAANKTVNETGAAIAYSSNYRVIGYGAKLEDLSQGTVLFEEKKLCKTPSVVAAYYTNDALDTKMAGLTNGTYRLSFTVDSGPLTSLEQSVVPSTTKSVEFTVNDKAPTGKVSLSAPASATKGQTVDVQVISAEPFDVADVEVKFDTAALTYKPTSQGSNGLATQNGGIINVARVSAGAKRNGSVAKLSFTANEDIANVADMIQVKSAMLSNATDANTADMVKVMDGSDVCASLKMGDVSANAWYHDAVDYVLENGIMSGYNASTFGPNDTLSRAMVVQVLYNKEGQPAVTAANKFPDIAGDQWYYNAVRWGAARNVVSGYGNGTFGPNDKVTVEQVAVILHNYSGKPTATGDLSSVGKYDDWAAGALQWAVANGVLENVPFTNATENATRAQTAQMLTNFLSK